MKDILGSSNFLFLRETFQPVASSFINNCDASVALIILSFFCVILTASSSDNDKSLNNSGSSIGMGRITGSASIETLGKY